MFLITKRKSAFLQLGLMMFLTIFTQTIMLIKTSVIALNFGISVEMDAFNFANSIGTFIYSFIGAGITTVLIPNLVNNNKKESINIFISIIYSIAFIVLILVYLSKGIIARSLSSGSEQFITLTCNIMFITLITQYIDSFTGTTNAIFQCTGKFNFPKLITLITSVILVFLLILLPNLTIYKYAVFILITTIINISLQVFLAIKGGYKFRYEINFKDKELKKILKVFVPTVLSTGLYQISLLVDTIISSNLGEGEISKLSYSNNIIGLINTIILTNIMVYFYPKIARNIHDDGNGQKKLFDLSILINAIMISIVIGFLVVGKDGIIILYERGKFTSEITSSVYMCTLIYIMGLPINAFRDLIYRYFYANGDTVTPFRNSLIISCLNIVISIILAKFIGIYGVILGTVLTSYISLSMILIKFSKKFKFTYNKKVLMYENLKLIFAALISISMTKALKCLIPHTNVIIEFILYGILLTLFYIAILYIFKSRSFKLDLSE